MNRKTPRPQSPTPRVNSLNAVNVIVEGGGDTTVRRMTPEQIAAIKRLGAPRTQTTPAVGQAVTPRSTAARGTSAPPGRLVAAHSSSSAPTLASLTICCCTLPGTIS